MWKVPLTSPASLSRPGALWWIPTPLVLKTLLGITWKIDVIVFCNRWKHLPSMPSDCSGLRAGVAGCLTTWMQISTCCDWKVICFPFNGQCKSEANQMKGWHFSSFLAKGNSFPQTILAYQAPHRVMVSCGIDKQSVAFHDNSEANTVFSSFCASSKYKNDTLALACSLLPVNLPQRKHRQP